MASPPCGCRGLWHVSSSVRRSLLRLGEGRTRLSLLLEDADRSATSALGGSRPRYTFEGCPTHRNAYVASRSTRACSRVGCPRAKTHVKEGIPLCDEHLRPTVTWHDELQWLLHDLVLRLPEE